MKKIISKIKNDGAFSTLTASIFIIILVMLAVFMTMDVSKALYVRSSHMKSAQLASNYAIRFQYPSGGLTEEAAKKAADEYFVQRGNTLGKSAFAGCSSQGGPKIEIRYYSSTLKNNSGMSGGTYQYRNGQVVNIGTPPNKSELRKNRYDIIRISTVEYSANMATTLLGTSGWSSCQKITISATSRVFNDIAE